MQAHEKIVPRSIFRQARPFYCAHQCAVQLAGGTLAECGWDPSTLLPDMDQLRQEVERGVKMVVITTPGELCSSSAAVCCSSRVCRVVVLELRDRLLAVTVPVCYIFLAALLCGEIAVISFLFLLLGHP